MSNVKIMIIDDDKIFLEELQELLALSGYDLIAVNDSQEAVDKALKIKPHIILVDLRMNNLNGFQVAERLKRYPEIADTHIVAMSGHFGMDEDARLFDACGIKRFLKKPFNPLDVISVIEELANKSKGGD